MLKAKEALKLSKKNAGLSEFDLLLKEVEAGIEQAVSQGETDTTLSVDGGFEAYQQELHNELTEAGYHVGFDMDTDTCRSRLLIRIKWAK